MSDKTFAAAACGTISFKNLKIVKHEFFSFNRKPKKKGDNSNYFIQHRRVDRFQRVGAQLNQNFLMTQNNTTNRQQQQQLIVGKKALTRSGGSPIRYVSLMYLIFLNDEQLQRHIATRREYRKSKPENSQVELLLQFHSFMICRFTFLILVFSWFVLFLICPCTQSRTIIATL